MNIRPFTDQDWDAFAGARSFGDDTPPLMCDVTAGSLHAVLIADATGVYAAVSHADDSGDIDFRTLYAGGLSPQSAAAVLGGFAAIVGAPGVAARRFLARFPKGKALD